MTKKPLWCGQTGFTLVEIIAVLVIMGLLAAVAVPKYFDLQTQARTKALDGALAEGAQRVHIYFGKQILAGHTPGQVSYTATNLGTNAGEFELSYTSAGGTITIKAKGKAGTVLAGDSKEKQMKTPGS